MEVGGREPEICGVAGDLGEGEVGPGHGGGGDGGECCGEDDAEGGAAALCSSYHFGDLCIRVVETLTPLKAKNRSVFEH